MRPKIRFKSADSKDLNSETPKGPTPSRSSFLEQQRLIKKPFFSPDHLHSSANRNSIYCNPEGWIGNPLDSISTLFDTLAEASLTPDSKPLEHYYGMFLGDFTSKQNGNYGLAGNLPPGTPLDQLNIPQLLDYQDPLYAFGHHQPRSNSQYSREKPKYMPIIVEGSTDRNETYIAFALEAALIGLGQQRMMPSGEYLQEKSLKQEERLIAKLIDLEFNHNLYPVLRKQVLNLLNSGPYSGLGEGGCPAAAPCQRGQIEY